MLAAVVASDERSGVGRDLRGTLRGDGEHGFFEPDVRDGELSDGVPI